MTVVASLVSRLARGASFVESEGPVTASRLTSWGAPTATGIPVSEQSSFRTIAVYRAVSLLGGTAAGLPLKAYIDGDDRQRIRPALLERPHPQITPFAFAELVFVHLLAWGNHYSLKRRDGSGMVTRLEPLVPSAVRVVQDSAARTPANPLGRLYEIRLAGQRIAGLTDFDVWHVAGLGFDGLTGLSPLGLAREAVSVAQAGERLAGQYMGRTAHIHGVLEADGELDDGAARDLKEQWQTRVAGLDRAGEVLVLEQGIKFKPLTIPADDLQFVESRKMQVIEIARLYGIPPHLLGETDKQTSFGAGIESLNRALQVYTLGPWLNRVADAWTWQLLGDRRYAEYDTAGLLKGDTPARFQAYASAISAGWMSVNEVRAREQLPPLEGLDLGAKPMSARQIAEILQKIYLAAGPGKVISADEARQILNRDGAGLVGSAPSERPRND